MDLREKFQDKPIIGYALGGILVLVAMSVIIKEVVGSHKLPPGVSEKAYYTTEDQLTGDAALKALFVDDVNKAPPFDHNGKPAYLAEVYVCDDGKYRWVNTLRRYLPDVKPKVDAAIAQGVAQGAKYRVDTRGFDENGMEIKAPGPGSWVKMGDPSYFATTDVRVPEGAKSDDLVADVP